MAKGKAVAQVAANDTKDQDFEVGDLVKFLGYDDGVPEDQQILSEGEVYTIEGFTEEDGDDPGGDIVVSVDNPDFNDAKKEHPETNPRFLSVQVFAAEVELVSEEDTPEEVEDAKIVEDVKVVEIAKKRGRPPGAKNVAKADKEVEDVKPVSKGKDKKAAEVSKTKAKPVAAKQAKATKKAEEPTDPLAVPDLESEDPGVMALVEESDDLIATVQELDEQNATNEYQIGGLLYHIKKDKTHLSVMAKDGKTPLYAADKAGWEQFLEDHFNISYRKTQCLIDIYVSFNKIGITDAGATVAAIGWAKAQLIARKFDDEATNPEELIELAKENTSKDLSEMLKSTEADKAEGGERTKKILLKFKYKDEEAATVGSILKTAQEQFGLKDVGEALLQIVMEWATVNAGGSATKESAPSQKAPVKAVGRKSVKA